MTYLASDSLLAALNRYDNIYEPEDSTDSYQKETYNSRYEWLEIRGYFLRSYAKGITGAVYNFACALFKTFRSIFQGNLEKKEKLRNEAIERYKNVGQDIIYIFISLVGVITPKGASWIYDKYQDLEEDDDDIKPLI